MKTLRRTFTAWKRSVGPAPLYSNGEMVGAGGKFFISHLPGGHPERIARRQTIGERARARLESGAAQNVGERSGREIVAMGRDVITAPLHTADGAVPAGVIRSLDYGNAAG